MQSLDDVLGWVLALALIYGTYRLLRRERNLACRVREVHKPKSPRPGFLK